MMRQKSTSSTVEARSAYRSQLGAEVFGARPSNTPAAGSAATGEGEGGPGGFSEVDEIERDDPVGGIEPEPSARPLGEIDEAASKEPETSARSISTDDTSRPNAEAASALSPPSSPVAPASNRELSLVERSRTSVLQFLTLVVMATLGVILFVAAQKGMGLEIPLLAIVALCACLYALARERALREEQHQMTVQLIARERQMTRMNRRISEERERSEVLWNRLDEITSLYRAISAIKAAEDPSQALSTVVRAACELIGADCGSLQLLDDTKTVLTVEATEGERHGVLGATQEVREGVAGWVLRNEEVVLLTGKAYEDPRFDHTLEQSGVAVECSMAVPLTWHGEALGVLNVGLSEALDKRSFDDHEQSLVRIFAEHAALVVVASRELRRRTLGGRKLRP